MDKHLAETRRSNIKDAALRSALRRLERSLRARFGPRFVKLILFGSRARGDNRPDSDADVAVVLRGHIEKPWAAKVAIIKDAYPILLETGLYIQPFPIEERSLSHPESALNPELIQNILQDGVQP